MRDTCLVLEGGGNRGVYTSGVLDAFMDNNIDIKDIYGVSAGALNAISYLSKQRGRSYEINKKIVMDKKSINYFKIIKSDALNLDYILKDLNNDSFDYETFKKNNHRFIAVSSDIDNGKPVYAQIKDFYEDIDYIKASASLPLFAKIVKKDGYNLLDGGMTDSIPLYKAIDDGYRKIIVVLTRDKDFRAKEYALMRAYKARYNRKYPELIKAMEERHIIYNAVREEIARLASEGKIIVIYPSRPLKIKNLEKNEEKLEEIYKLGYNDALKEIEKINSYLGGKPHAR